MNLKQYTQLKEQVEKKQREVERARGALDQLFKRLKEEHKCKSTKEAKEKVAELKKEVERLDGQFNKALKAFEDKWGHKL